MHTHDETFKAQSTIPGTLINGYKKSTDMANGYYRSGIRPVSKSSVPADVQDYKTYSQNNRLFAGCKLVGSDFNMPVTTTVDGGAVVEITDTNPNSLVIGNPSAGVGAIEAVSYNETMR